MHWEYRKRKYFNLKDSKENRQCSGGLVYQNEHWHCPSYFSYLLPLPLKFKPVPSVMPKLLLITNEVPALVVVNTWKMRWFRSLKVKNRTCRYLNLLQFSKYQSFLCLLKGKKIYAVILLKVTDKSRSML